MYIAFSVGNSNKKRQVTLLSFDIEYYSFKW